ncbi:uncharacterized protein HMPREF1541_00552 [Cyphellophora europaea CBS 101466]|uniref:RanBD1 domain-containing protein n=1 Tax=Cyphellophora europaea (strain CBS 101466) TaxID=1220924 RepID=W2SEC7_CYPE1|nr:uncharacterized protein HMPREF1541_00552 [Cyphellophora europaea CBS 101466]ETN46368.1 hypothetical protein HMPREF1541_00552 [Cyphellophora europaea CBS 101466]
MQKEHGATQNQTGTEEKPHMASAAQMATRKTATPRGRLNRAGTPQRRFPPSANTSNPFSTIPQQTFGAVGNGVVFGAGSQDTSNNASQPTGAFTFSANNTSASNPFASNPFANVNNTPSFGGPNNQNNQNNEDDSMDTGSPEKKRSRTENPNNFGGFGQTSSTPASNAPTFSFGATPSQPPGMNQSQPATGNPFAGMFGTQTSAPQSQSMTPAGGLFGSQSSSSVQQSPAPAFAFGQSQTQTASEQPPAKPAFSFGQQSTPSSTSAQQSSAATPAFFFGQPSKSTSTSAQETPASKPTFSFGQPAQSAPEPQPSKSLFNFGSNAQSAIDQTPKSTSLFGATTQPPTQQQSPNPAPLFGSQFSTQSTATQDSPLTFGAKPASTSETPKQVTSFFGQSAQTASEQSPAKPVFTFGKPTEATSEVQQPAAPASPAFSFGKPSTSSTSAEQPKTSFTGFSFGQSTSSDASKTPAPSTGADKRLFSESSLSKTPSNSFGNESTPMGADNDTARPAQSNLFGGVGNSTSEQPKFSALFGQTSTSKPTSGTSGNVTASKPSFSFGQPSSTNSSPPKQNASVDLFGKSSSPAEASPDTTATAPLFGAAQGISKSTDGPVKSSEVFGSTTPSSGGILSPAKSATATNQNAHVSSIDSAPSTEPKKTLFGTLSKPAPAGLGGQSASSVGRDSSDVSTGNATNVFAAAKAAPKNASSDVATQRPVYTKSPSRMPKFLNAEGFMEYDKNYRLRALNKEFQKQVAAIDPDRNDFENLIRHYAAARAAIGGDMGLYQRSTAGSKRKSDEVEEDQAVPPQYKKARVAEPQVAQSQSIEPSSNQNTFNIEKQAAGSASIAPKSTTSTKATSLFNNMIPPSSQQTTSQASQPSPAKGSNPFAGVSFLPTNDSTTKPSASFGNNTVNAGSTPAAKKTTSIFQATGSTTPMKSPPKNNLFGNFSTEPVGSKKRKSSSDAEDAEDAEHSSDDEAPKKRSKSSTGNANNIFGNSNSTTLAKTGTTTPSKKTRNPFVGSSDSDNEEDDDADVQTGDDAEDGDFAPNADGSDDEDDSADEESQQLSEEDIGQTPQDDSETSAAPDEDHTEEIKRNPNTGKSLFDRIEPGKRSDASGTSTPTQVNGTTSAIKWPTPSVPTPDAPDFSPITPGSKSPFKPATTFHFTPAPATKPTHAPGASVLAGGFSNGLNPRFEGMFGSRPSTPEPEKSTDASAAPSSTPAGDHTWKKGQDIKFNLTEASPGKPADQGTNALGFSFGSGSTSAPAPGFLGVAPHLTGGSGISSVTSSRATSPGATDNESVATDDTNHEEAQSDPQSNLMQSNSGEENEDVLYEGKTKALVLAKGERAKQLRVTENKWETIGTGMMKLLKNRDSGRVRVVLRSEPAANIVLNSYLESEVNYVVKEQTSTQKSGAVQGAFMRDGNLDQIVMKVRDNALATKLAGLMTEHKKDGL